MTPEDCLTVSILLDVANNGYALSFPLLGYFHDRPMEVFTDLESMLARVRGLCEEISALENEQ